MVSTMKFGNLGKNVWHFNAKHQKHLLFLEDLEPPLPTIFMESLGNYHTLLQKPIRHKTH
jgi:hypothetical protein